jgi:pilus assembly protein CpaB
MSMLSATLLWACLSVPAVQEGLVVPEGHRAIALKITPTGAADGFVLPGGHVDVLVTRQVPNGSVTRTVARNLVVLAVDQKAPRPDEKVAAELVVTLAAKPDVCDQLLKAAKTGKLSLALRPLGEK